MKTRIPILIAVACGGLLLLAPAAVAQSRPVPPPTSAERGPVAAPVPVRPQATDRAPARDRGADRAQDGRSERELVSLLERLEMGMSALTEMGRGPEAELVGRAADQVRRQLAARRAGRANGRDAERPRGGPEGERVRDRVDLSERAQRLQVLRWARDAHREAGHEDAVELANRFIHLGEVQESGAGPEDVAAAADGLRMESAVRILRAGAELYDEKGWEGRAGACRQLADFYTERLQPQVAPEVLREAHAAELRARMARLQAELEALRAELQRIQDRPLPDRR